MAGMATIHELAVRPRAVLSIDIGGSKCKILCSGQTEPRRFLSGRKLTPTMMVEQVKELTRDWAYDVISIGYPGLVGPNGPISEPGNLGPGWVGFDFSAAFDHPVRMMNDAAMQALGSYEGGRMLFLGLGTGVGSTLILDNTIVSLELGELPFDAKKRVTDVLSRRALDKIGKKKWRAAIDRLVLMLTKAFVVDYVVVGGGNARKLRVLPAGVRLGHNLTAFRGGFRLWTVADVKTLGEDKPQELPMPTPSAEWRLV